MKLEKKRLNVLKHSTYNPRKKLKPDDEEYQKILNSIQKFGYVDPIIINKDNTIIGGHQRATVLADIGWEEVDVVILDIPKNEEKALNIALNKISGEWDFIALKDVLEELKLEDFDLSITGFNDDEIDNLFNNLDIDHDDFFDSNFQPTEKEPTIIICPYCKEEFEL